MVPYVSCMQHRGVTGTMWEPCGSCVGRMGSGWCHAPSVGHMGTVCAVWEVDGIWEPFGSILEADGNIWELIAPYGGHMGAVFCHAGAVWEPYGSLFAPYRSQNGANCEADLQAVCTVWEPYALYGSCWRHMGAIWKPCGPYWRWMRTIWEPIAPYGSHLLSTGGGWLMGAMRCHMGDRWHHMGGRWG
jgi:hypothetical protein